MVDVSEWKAEPGAKNIFRPSGVLLEKANGKARRGWKGNVGGLLAFEGSKKAILLTRSMTVFQIQCFQLGASICSQPPSTGFIVIEFVPRKWRRLGMSKIYFLWGYFLAQRFSKHGKMLEFCCGSGMKGDQLRKNQCWNDVYGFL